MKTTKEEFEAWRDHPVTEDVFRALKQLGEEAKSVWLQASWGKGQCDPVLLADLRARAEVVNDLRELSFEELEAVLNDDEPEWHPAS